MANDLFSLFDERLKSERDLVASDPQTLDTISSDQDEQDRLVSRIRRLEEVEPKVDYSNFSNFVFFNSALDYFNITGEKILNEYPYDGTVADVENFYADLDGYQRYVVDNWPKNSGHLRFNPSVSASWIRVEDVGVADGQVRSTFISPGTASLSVEFWMNTPAALTGTNDVMVIAQKVTGSGDGFTVYLSGSSVLFRMVSGSTTSELSAPFTPQIDSFFSCVFDRTSAPVMRIMTGSAGSFPVVATSASSAISGQVYLGPTYFTMASGTLSGKVTRPFTGSFDQVSVWNVARNVYDVSASYNTKLTARDGLLALYRFSESGSIPSYAGGNIVYDYAGRRLNGRIQNYYTQIRGSGSVVPLDSPDLIISFDSPEVQYLIYNQQQTASLYDRSNDNIVTNLFPSKYFEMEEERNTSVLKNFLYVLARNFDYIKVRIDQFVNVLKVSYSSFDQTPDALLADVARFFGWEFTGNFLGEDVVQYMLGRNVLANGDANRELDTKLYQVKNEFWRRTLLNLMHIYKTKGTRESVESLLRAHGVNQNFVRLKEYGYRQNVGLITQRVHAEKSQYALAFGSGSGLPIPILTSSVFSSPALAVETRVRFPTTTSSAMTASISSGSIWNVSSGTYGLSLLYTKSDPTSITGSLILTGTEGSVSITNVPVFDGGWYNLVANRNPTSGTLRLDVLSLDRDTISYWNSGSVSASVPSTSSPWTFKLGATGSYLCQHWAQEARVWDRNLSLGEMADHTLNYQSFGSNALGSLGAVALHWRLAENLSASAGGVLQGTIYDISGRNGTVSSSGFYASSNPYRRFLFDYNYVASPDMGWTEDKVRVLNGSSVKPGDVFADSPIVALEFNMVDALNEDISQMLSTIGVFNNSMGLPPNRYRATYEELANIRKQYFARLQGRLNFRVFADMLEFFDRSFIDMVRKLIPAHAMFLGDTFVVESHMLERPKLQWNYRRQQPVFAPMGVIKIYER